MSAPVRVARVDEIPPGQGKIVQIGSRDIAVYNLEGRYYAAAAHPGHVGATELPGHASAAPCEPHGQRFEAAVPDSPADTLSGEPRYRVTTDAEFVLLHLEEAAAD